MQTAHTHTHTPTNPHTHTRAHLRTHVRTHAHTHARTHTRTHTRATPTLEQPLHWYPACWLALLVFGHFPSCFRATRGSQSIAPRAVIKKEALFAQQRGHSARATRSSGLGKLAQTKTSNRTLSGAFTWTKHLVARTPTPNRKGRGAPLHHFSHLGTALLHPFAGAAGGAASDSLARESRKRAGGQQSKPTRCGCAPIRRIPYL